MNWRSGPFGVIPQPVRRLIVPTREELRHARVTEALRQRSERQAAEARDAALQAEAKPVARAAPPQPAAPQRPAGPPSETERLRLSLQRKLDALLQTWRGCPVRACQRHRACASPLRECTALPRSRRTSSPAAEAAALAALKRGIARRWAELPPGPKP